MVNRRNILKAVATGTAASVVGFSGTTSAADVSESERSELLSNADVQTLLDEAGDPEITDADRYRQVVDGTEISAVDFTTAAGQLQVLDLGDGDLNAAFLFDGSSSALPPEYQQVPNVGKSILAVESGEAVFARQATSEERSQLQSNTRMNLDGSEIFYNSVVDGFEITFPSTSTDSAVEGSTGDVSTESGSSNVVFEANRYGEITSTEPRIYASTECDVFACAAFGVTIGGASGACGYVCKAGNFAGPYGKAACLVCLLAAGVSLSGPCLTCAETCG